MQLTASSTCQFWRPARRRACCGNWCQRDVIRPAQQRRHTHRLSPVVHACCESKGSRQDCASHEAVPVATASAWRGKCHVCVWSVVECCEAISALSAHPARREANAENVYGLLISIGVSWGCAAMFCAAHAAFPASHTGSWPWSLAPPFAGSGRPAEAVAPSLRFPCIASSCLARAALAAFLGQACSAVHEAAGCFAAVPSETPHLPSQATLQLPCRRARCVEHTDA